MTVDKKESVEQAILEAAEQEFLEKGYSGAKTADIAKRAGVTHAMLHYYYRTKENIFEVFANRKINELKELARMSLDVVGLNFPDRVRKMINLHFDFLMEHPDLPRFVLNEIVTKPERLRELKMMVFRAMDTSLLQSAADELKAALQRGEVRPISLFDLFFDAVSLNMAAFISIPTVKEVLGDDVSTTEYLEARRKENIELITRRLEK